LAGTSADLVVDQRGRLGEFRQANQYVERVRHPTFTRYIVLVCVPVPHAGTVRIAKFEGDTPEFYKDPRATRAGYHRTLK